MDQLSRVFVDTSKSIFQVHGVGADETVLVRKALRRSQFVAFFAALSPTVVGMEACGASHHWARVLGELGHEVKLIAAQHVKPYVKRNKNDARDAQAGCEAMSRPTMEFVPIKSAEQQGALMLVGVREGLVRRRTQLSNRIRGYAAEFGLTTAQGKGRVGPMLDLIAADEHLPQMARRMFAVLGQDLCAIEAQLRQVEADLMVWHRSNRLSQRLAKIPGVGPIGACLLVMKTPDPASFKSGRQFAAWAGLTPKDHSTAGKTRMGVITRAGDEALRSTLVVGATAVIQHVRSGKTKPSAWLQTLLKTKPPKLAAVALANKIARVAWKLIITGEDYDAARSMGGPGVLVT